MEKKDRRITLNKGPLLAALIEEFQKADLPPNGFVSMKVERWLAFEERGLTEPLAAWLSDSSELLSFLAALQQLKASESLSRADVQANLLQMIARIIGSRDIDVASINTQISSNEVPPEKPQSFQTKPRGIMAEELASLTEPDVSESSPRMLSPQKF